MSRLARWAMVLWGAVLPPVFSQEDQPPAQGVLLGKIFDAVTQKPIGYANVILFNTKDSALVAGTVSEESGGFRLDKIAPGRYYVHLQFIGYKTRRFADIVFGPAQHEIDLGKIFLQQTTLEVEGVEVQAEALGMTYQIDKKVINVSQQQTALSGTAVDVLENVPAVTVDIEGNVSLRGSGSFTLLVDGRPSVLEPSEALQQIPAGTIENIEIITNPSAKYDPQGGAGIINIVLKKERRAGRSGIANLNAGSGDKYGGDFLYEHKHETYQATFGADYNRRLLTGFEREANQTAQQGTTSFLQAEGGSQRKDVAMGVRGEMRLHPGRRDFLSLGGRYGTRESQRGTKQNYAEWSAPASGESFYTSLSDRFRDREFYALHLSYQHQFAPKGHELAAEVFLSRRQADESTTNGLVTPELVPVSGKRSTEAGPSRDLRARLDYARALGAKAKFEAGFHSDFDRDEEHTGLAEYDTTSGEFVVQPQFSKRTRYDEDTHALYAMSSGEWGRLGYQAGLRGEYTGRDIVVSGAPQAFVISRWDYFPTVHLSRQLSTTQQAMASYTRRISRPRGGELEPFPTWTDAYNVHVGNPALQPEYIDSYELGYQTQFGPSLFSLDTYYRKTHNKIEDLRSVYAENVTLHTVDNVGEEYSLGSELGLNFDLLNRWKVNATANLYDYRIEGALYGEAFARHSFNWRTRLSNTIKFGKSAQMQLDGMYNSPSASTQGRRAGFFMANAAVRYEIFAKLLSATLQARDLFGSAKSESLSQGADFYSYRYATREAPVVMLNLKYNFNNYKPERERRSSGDDPGEEEF